MSLKMLLRFLDVLYMLLLTEGILCIEILSVFEEYESEINDERPAFFVQSENDTDKIVERFGDSVDVLENVFKFDQSEKKSECSKNRANILDELQNQFESSENKPEFLDPSENSILFGSENTPNISNVLNINIEPSENEREHLDASENGAGKPLFLTPLIEAGKIKEARRMSAVKMFLRNIHSYAGYLTVDKRYNSNTFFWFFLCDKDWENSPVTVWLQGGPGGSGLFGLFLENGPYILKKNKLIRRNHSWHKSSNIIYFDSPVGTGFSFTDPNGYAKNQTVIGELLYEAVRQFFILFPNLRKNPFFITGESYAGKYIPALGYTIHVRNSEPLNGFKINLQGLFIGNGLTDPINMLKYGDYIYQLGIIDFNDLKVFRKYENEIRANVKKQNWSKATYLFGKLVLGYVYYPQGSYFGNVTGFDEHYNYINENSGQWTPYHANFVNSTLFRRAIHVGDMPRNRPLNVALALKDDIMKSVLPWVVELLNHYRVVFYNGQLDIICAYPLTENFLKNMKWKSACEYAAAKRQVWKVDKRIAGYFKTAGNLTEVLVRNAGHLVPTDQPLWAHVLFKKFISNSSLAESDYSL